MSQGKKASPRRGGPGKVKKTQGTQDTQGGSGKVKKTQGTQDTQGGPGKVKTTQGTQGTQDTHGGQDTHGNQHTHGTHSPRKTHKHEDSQNSDQNSDSSENPRDSLDDSDDSSEFHFPSWKCEFKDVEEFTVGDKKKLVCQGEYIERLIEPIHIVPNHKDLKWVLHPLELVSAENESVTLLVTSYQSGQFSNFRFCRDRGGGFRF